MKIKQNKIELRISKLPHTWIIDFDGTIFIHNEYKKDKQDKVCNSNVQKFFDQLSLDDFIIFTTSRGKYLSDLCEKSIRNKINLKQKYCIVYDLPQGERILINDTKPKGLLTSLAIPINRDEFPEIKIILDPNL